jgi:hypothetical protein
VSDPADDKSGFLTSAQKKLGVIAAFIIAVATILRWLSHGIDTADQYVHPDNRHVITQPFPSSN